ncbi:AMP-binding protein [uncultured Microbacterium sp.]|uniref:Putative 2-succinylbenzoate--CoA ligase n=1 Tax=uncultured Microbacterium sp. TaxID=191216 RepID=A0A1Y5NYH0_9MICO|nr:AMP-binding protein [uncultured Microbacterium sp.]SBS71547.1 putative 2-succinylbenzoate--CoA ligase [uncultured Microbacterium sp.]
MRLEPVDTADARAVLRALRGAVLGAGPAVALGATAPRDVPAGTAVVVTTSGSTGYPKSVVLSRAALTSGALATADRLGSGSWLLALPPSYIAGVQVLVRALVADREPAILSGPFHPAAFAAAAAGMASSEGGRRVPTYTSLVPAQLQTLLDAGETDPRIIPALASFEAILVGGQALPAALAARAAAAGARVVRTYGSSETSGGCVYDGVPLDGVGVRVTDGEVQLSGPMLADGYLDDPERTEATFLRDADGTRWYRTGDAGTFDGGMLRVTGRIDNVIVSGGINVSLDRVEHVVRALPGLASAVVVPVADERWGQASVVVAPRAAGRDADDLLAVVRPAVADALGAPARPRAVVLVEEMPHLPSGKPDRAALRALADG